MLSDLSRIDFIIIHLRFLKY